jgi:hypothetical protein
LSPGGEIARVNFANKSAAPSSSRQTMDPRTVLQLAHILILGPLLVVIGLGYVDAWSMAIAGLGAFITLYHGFKVYTKWTAGQAFWVNLFHALIVGPVLMAKGLLDSPRYVDEFILMFGFAAIGYHALYLIKGQL